MADILLSNIEMPKGINTVSILIFADGRVWPNNLHAEEYVKKNAKAIELPEHKRLMEVEPYQLVLLKWEREAREHGDEERADAYKRAREILDDRDAIMAVSEIPTGPLAPITRHRCRYYQFSEKANCGEHEYCQKKKTYNFECKIDCPDRDDIVEATK